MDEKRDVLRPLDGEAVGLARSLLRTARFGALATLDPQTGAPLASRVALATDVDGTPIILISALAAHTGALRADPRCSLLVGEPGKGDPLAHSRMTIACRAEEMARGTPLAARIERRYLARQPKAKLYAGFGDFAFFVLQVETASLNGGFGRAYVLGADEIVLPRPADALVNGEAAAVAHMNGEHADAVAIYARAYAGADDGGWAMTGIDPEGMDLALGDTIVRIPFPAPLSTASDVRTALVQMAVEGRKLLADR